MCSSAQWLRSMVEQRLRMNRSCEAGSSNYFERTMNAKHARAVISRAEWLRGMLAQGFRRIIAATQSRAMLSSEQQLRRMFEQRVRAQNGFEACSSSECEGAVASQRARAVVSKNNGCEADSSSDVERTVDGKHARAVTSSAVSRAQNYVSRAHIAVSNAQGAVSSAEAWFF